MIERGYITMANKTQQDFTIGIDGLFSSPSTPTDDLHHITDPQEVPGATDTKQTYNFNLKMPLAWKKQIAYQAWLRRETITDLMNDIVGEWLTKHYQEDTWKEDQLP